MTKNFAVDEMFFAGVEHIWNSVFKTKEVRKKIEIVQLLFVFVFQERFIYLFLDSAFE